MKWLAVALVMLPQVATALSCARPDIGQQFSRAEASDHSYAVLHGVISQTNEAYMFQGRALAQGGWSAPYVTELSVQTICAGQWCGAVRTDVDGVFFVKQTSQGLLFEAGPCNAWAYYGPRLTDIDTAEQCMSSGLC